MQETYIQSSNHHPIYRTAKRPKAIVLKRIELVTIKPPDPAVCTIAGGVAVAFAGVLVEPPTTKVADGRATTLLVTLTVL